jgi:hypothetical protein
MDSGEVLPAVFQLLPIDLPRRAVRLKVFVDLGAGSAMRR